MALSLLVNGELRSLPLDAGAATLEEVVAGLGLKLDRVAVEHNREIAPRRTWSDLLVRDGDRLEVVHFVGGGKVEAVAAG